MTVWNYEKSAELYGIERWGNPYFGINEKGHVTVAVGGFSCDGGAGAPTRVDLQEIVESLVERGIELPILLRFDGILRSRANEIQRAFDNAIREFNYGASYRLVYPIKVNQQRHVVDVIREAGRNFQIGLEVGSKPEMLAVLAIHDGPDALLVCNGYKDEGYVELALLSRKLGRRPIIVIEQPQELDIVLEVSARLGIEAEVGIRFKPLT
ncbi:MAG: arginine decarboxylase, partial [Bdellovibrionales bacterium]|nr:arginine decarboxylase [Bdellovibrionales bacterium]